MSIFFFVFFIVNLSCLVPDPDNVEYFRHHEEYIFQGDNLVIRVGEAKSKGTGLSNFLDGDLDSHERDFLHFGPDLDNF